MHDTPDPVMVKPLPMPSSKVWKNLESTAGFQAQVLQAVSEKMKVEPKAFQLRWKLEARRQLDRWNQSRQSPTSWSLEKVDPSTGGFACQVQVDQETYSLQGSIVPLVDQPAVRRGQDLTVSLVSGNLTMQCRNMRALQTGRIGQTILAVHPETKKKITVRLTGIQSGELVQDVSA